MNVAITLGNVLVVNREIMSTEKNFLAHIVHEHKTLIHTTLMNLWASVSLDNHGKRITKPSMWVMYLGPRDQVIQFTTPDSQNEIFRHSHDITPPFREFWKIIEDAGYLPQVRCSKLLDKQGAFLLLSEGP